MPHYANGKEAKIGDLVICSPKLPENASKTVGLLVAITSNADQCNGQLLPVARKWSGIHWAPVIALYQDCITLKDCLLVEDTQ